MANTVFLAEAEFQKIFRDHLRIEPKVMSIESLFGLRMVAKVDYSPYYQRNYVWDTAKATYFVESILLGTEIPPLVFFANNSKIEVIDGRQRYETIKRFMNDQFALAEKGLERLKKLVRSTYSKLPNEVSTLFIDTKLRIIQFEIVGDPPLDASLEDKIKKEIFRRYNTGITPLRRAELDNAVYDSDDLTKFLKAEFDKNPTTANRVQDLFLHISANTTAEVNPQSVLQFIRRILVLWKYPIKYYARGSGRSETLEHLYDCFAQHDCGDPSVVSSQIERVVSGIWKLKQSAEAQSVKTNRFFWECLFWAMLILDQEGKDSVEIVARLSDDLLRLVTDEAAVFFNDASHYFRNIVDRYSRMGNFFQTQTGVDFSVFLAGDDEAIENLKVRGGRQDTETQLSQLAELRVNKPDPSKVSIDDIIKKMTRRRFLLRPSYQRGEVISPTKASEIIESILLGVALPPIFVFRRKDEVSEVVDGQQRLLTILGFIGQQYCNEKNEQVSPKNRRFALRDLRILTELSGKRFEDLSESQQSKIYDFELFMVEIQQALNPQFDPVDLFVRLNDKPYPIKEHSFEMWNSWADTDCITKIRDNTERVSSWFYVRRRQADDRYRMQNEELYTSLVFFDYNEDQQGAAKYPSVFSKRGSVAARIKDKAVISAVWTKVSEVPEAKKRWLESTSRIESFLRKLKTVLIDRDVEGDVSEFLCSEVDELVRSPEQRYAIRSSQDFYFLWLILSPLNPEMVRFRRLEIKAEIRKIIQSIKVGLGDATLTEKDPFALFQEQLANFHTRYQKDGRSLKLTDAQKAELIRSQKGTCAISGAPIFVGDDVAVDHTEPLAIGGRDSVENVQIATPEANSRKGPRSN